MLAAMGIAIGRCPLCRPFGCSAFGDIPSPVAIDNGATSGQPPVHFQDIIQTLNRFWAERGCLISSSLKGPVHLEASIEVA